MATEPNQPNQPNQPQRKLLARIENPTFINELPETFQSVMYRAIKEILNLRGNSATAKYRNLQWHNDQTRLDSKRDRHFQLIQKIRECYIIYLDYNNVVNYTPELAEACRMYSNRNDILELKMSFEPLAWTNYRKAVEGGMGYDYSPKVGSEHYDTVLYNTETFETYPYYSSNVARLIEQVDFLDSELEEIFPIYSYVTDAPATKQNQSRNTSQPSHKSSGQVSPNHVAKLKEHSLKLENLILTKIVPVASDDITNYCYLALTSIEQLISSLKFPHPHAITTSDTLPPVLYQKQMQQLLDESHNEQPKSSAPSSFTALPNLLIPVTHVNVNKPTPPNSPFTNQPTPNSEAPFPKLWEDAPNYKSSSPSEQPTQLPEPPPLVTLDLAAINLRLGEQLSSMLAVPTHEPVTTPEPPATVQSKQEHVYYDSLFGEPVPDNIKQYTTVDFMKAGCPGGDFVAWEAEQKARDAAEGLLISDNHTSH